MMTLAISTITHVSYRRIFTPCHIKFNFKKMIRGYYMIFEKNIVIKL